MSISSFMLQKDPSKVTFVKFELQPHVLVSTISLLFGNKPPSNETEIIIVNTSGTTELVGKFDNNVQPLDWKIFHVDPPKKVKKLTVQQKDGKDLRILFIEIFS